MGDRQAAYQDKRNVENKAHLIEPIIRHRIQDSVFYKQYLYMTNEATIVPIIVSHVKYIAGPDAIGRPSAFLCCLLRLLELEPSEDIVDVYRTQMDYNEFKYLTALVLMYIRLVGTSKQVYNMLDPYLRDYRKLRVRLKNPEFSEKRFPVHYKITYIDEFVDQLLTQERVLGLILPRLVERQVLVERGEVMPRVYGENSESESESESDNNESGNEPREKKHRAHGGENSECATGESPHKTSPETGSDYESDSD